MRLIDADTIFNNKVLFVKTECYDAVRAVIERINNAPTIDAEPVKHGHWVVDDDGNIKCSECGHCGVGDNYCERCGARMEEVNK